MLIESSPLIIGAMRFLLCSLLLGLLTSSRAQTTVSVSSTASHSIPTSLCEFIEPFKVFVLNISSGFIRWFDVRGGYPV